MKDFKMQNSSTPNFRQAHGPLRLTLVNDYLFKALMQRNQKVLIGFIASLLHKNISDITSIVITNEIELGKLYDDKYYVLDLKVILNKDTVINIELQVNDLKNWTERSLSYLCRGFDNLPAGSDYKNVMPTIQIGLLNYTLFPDAPEFYGSYHFFNDKSKHMYSDKLSLHVLDLTRIDLATDEDKAYGIDHWAKLFKAETWEDIQMLADNDEIIAEAAQSIYAIDQDRELYYMWRSRQDAIAQERILLEKANRVDIAEAKASEAIAEANKAKDEADKAKSEANKAKDEASKAKEAASKASSRIEETEKRLAAALAEIERLKAKNL